MTHATCRVTATRRRRGGGGEVDPASARAIVEEFLAAASSGRTERLVALLTDDTTAISDGAGLTETLLRYDTPQRIAAVVRAGFKPTPAKRRLASGTPAVHYALVNGAPALLFVVGDQVVGAVTFDITGGRIATVRGIAAPTRLAASPKPGGSTNRTHRSSPGGDPGGSARPLAFGTLGVDADDGQRWQVVEFRQLPPLVLGHKRAAASAGRMSPRHRKLVPAPDNTLSRAA